VTEEPSKLTDDDILTSGPGGDRWKAGDDDSADDDSADDDSADDDSADDDSADLDTDADDS
jgi:hypothetical protein